MKLTPVVLGASSLPTLHITVPAPPLGALGCPFADCPAFRFVSMQQRYKRCRGLLMNLIHVSTTIIITRHHRTYFKYCIPSSAETAAQVHGLLYDRCVHR